MQEVVKTVILRENVPSYLNEVEIEDASKIKIDYLIYIKVLEIISKEDRSRAMDDVSVVSFGEQSWFLTNSLLSEKEEGEKNNS